MKLGCHLSIAGGLHNALLLADKYRLDCVALFVRNQRQWHAPPLSDDAVKLFKKTRRPIGIAPVVAHGSYLVNLAGGPEVRGKSISACADELDRCCRLGIEYLVIHPGSHEDADEGIARIADALNRIIANAPPRGTKILLESTAGQGNCLGCSLEQIARMLEVLKPASRFGVCLDTCHLFANGYDIRTPGGYRETMGMFDDIVGMNRLAAFHINDSVKPLGSRVDRHAHIGKGKIGLKAFANIVNDSRFAGMPMILETPKGIGPRGEDFDEMNIAKIRRLVV